MQHSFTLDPDIQALLDERKRTMALFTDNHRPLKMYAIFNNELVMDGGKILAQSGHAFEMTYARALLERPDITAQYKGTGNGTKVCMYAKNLRQIVRAYRDCQAIGVPCELIIDRGHVYPPSFDGNPIITALGLGPAYEDEVKHITKRYTLM